MNLALNHAGVILFYETYNVRLDKIFLSFSFKYVKIFLLLLNIKIMPKIYIMDII